MSYLALAHDVQGLMIYPGSEGRRFLSMGDFPEVWAGVCELASQVRHLSPVLISPRYVDVQIEPAGCGVHALAKEYNGDTYLIAVNPTALPASPRFSLGDRRFSRVEVMFENKVLAAEGAAFRDLLEPLAARVYRLRSP